MLLLVALWGNMAAMRVAIHKESGKMGQALLKAIAQNPHFERVPLGEESVTIDVSRPEGTLDLLLTQSRPLVVGTTGHASLEPLKNCAQRVPVLYAPNFSLGILALKRAATAVQALLPEASCHIIETHHTEKVDKPSGTALMLEKSLKVDEVHSVRAVGNVGEHTLVFSTPNEEVTLTHRARSRALFAQGALIAAQKLLNMEPGFYELQDII